MDGWWQRLRRARLARPPVDRSGRASRSVQRAKHRRLERHRVQVRRPYHRTQRGRQLKQSTLDETYNHRTGVERTNESVKDCGLGRTHARGRVHARAQVFLALCLRLVVAITNYERGDNPGSTIITVREEFYNTLSVFNGDERNVFHYCIQLGRRDWFLPGRNLNPNSN
ncbi:transposase [Halostagnicola kamekurae]|uniref:transposase n=1 Tax=Halostagnicola kamekurae TaxID=619731 RepID=UPI000B82BE4A